MKTAPAHPVLPAKLAAKRAAFRATAENAGARQAPGYSLLSAAIKMGCRGAIKIAEKI